jgi:glycosyl transferase, family 25
MQISKLPEYFSAVYLINLPDRADRLKSATVELARVGWGAGINGVNVFSARRFADAAGFPSAGARGCFHSHLECLRQAHLETRGSVLILEDDITFTSSLPRLTSSILLKLETSDWDFVYFGHERTGNIPRANRNTTDQELKFKMWTGSICTAHFYGVRGRILPRLIKHLDSLGNRPPGDPEGGPMTIDGAFDVFRQRNRDVKTIIADPKLGWQRPSRSDLTPRGFDTLALLRPVTFSIRRLKHCIDRWGS